MSTPYKLDTPGAITGANLSAPQADAKRLAENRAFLRAQYEIAALCCVSPRLVLRGPAGADDLTPRDLHPADLTTIVGWFQNGGGVGAPAAADSQRDAGAPADSAGAADALPAESAA